MVYALLVLLCGGVSESAERQSHENKLSFIFLEVISSAKPLELPRGYLFLSHFQGFRETRHSCLPFSSPRLLLSAGKVILSNKRGKNDSEG